MKYAFVDSSGVLVAWGFMETNNSDTKIAVDLDFDLAPGQWQYVSGQWAAYPAAVPA
jgi:hypothetical protein